ncbi:MAG: DUF58 domain-containing protein [Fervidobacterium sp.]
MSKMVKSLKFKEKGSSNDDIRVTVRYSSTIYVIIFGVFILNLFSLNKYSIIIDAFVLYIFYDYFQKRKAIDTIEVKVLAKARVFTNEHFHLKFFLKAKTPVTIILNPPIIINKEFKVIRLQPNKEEIVTYTSSFGTRGNKVLGAYSIRIEGIWNIFNIIRIEEINSDIKVLPQFDEVENLVERILETIPIFKSTYKLSEDISYIRDIREYNNEPINRIHWKQSAKYDKLMVKDYEFAGTSKIYILLDLNLPTGIYSRNAWLYIRKKYEEDAIRAAAGFVSMFEARHEDTKLVISHKDGITKCFEKDFSFKYDQLADVTGEIDSKIDISDLVIEILDIVQPTDTVIIISMFLTRQEVKQIIDLKKRCGRVVVLIMPYGFRDRSSKKFKTYYEVPPEIRELYKYCATLKEENVLIEIWYENVSLSEGLMSLLEN